MPQQDPQTKRFVSTADDDTLIEVCRQAVVACRSDGLKRIRQQDLDERLQDLSPGCPLASSICQRLSVPWKDLVPLLERERGSLDVARLSDILSRSQRRRWPTLKEVECAFRIVALRIGREDFRREDYRAEHERIMNLDQRHWSSAMLSRYALPDDQQIDDALRRLHLSWYTAREQFGMAVPSKSVPGEAGMPVHEAILMFVADVGILPGPDRLREWGEVRQVRLARWQHHKTWKPELELAKEELLKVGPLPPSLTGRPSDPKWSYEGLEPVPADHPYRKKPHVSEPWTIDRIVQGLAFALGHLPKGEKTLSAEVLRVLARKHSGIVPHYSKVRRYGIKEGIKKPLPALRAEAIKLLQSGWTPPPDWDGPR